MNASNRVVVLGGVVAGVPDPSQFAVRERPMPIARPGEVLVRNLLLSIDPWLLPLLPALPLGSTIPGDAVGRVVQSGHPRFRPGDIVQGHFGWQEQAAAPWLLLRKLDVPHTPTSAALSVLGGTGATAYVGLVEIAQVQRGETVVVSAAAGAVGSIAAQVAKLHGCRVVGIAGSEAKVKYLVSELRLDAAINYKAGGDWRAALRMACPFGIDVYFDNVGARVSDAVAPLLNPHARVVVCGQIAEYSRRAPRAGFPWMLVALERRARIQGFLVSDYPHRVAEALAVLSLWLRSGVITQHETRVTGLENAPAALLGLLQGANIGKQLVELA